MGSSAVGSPERFACGARRCAGALRRSRSSRPVRDAESPKSDGWCGVEASREVGRAMLDLIDVASPPSGCRCAQLPPFPCRTPSPVRYIAADQHLVNAIGSPGASGARERQRCRGQREQRAMLGRFIVRRRASTGRRLRRDGLFAASAAWFCRRSTAASIAVGVPGASR